MDWLNYQPVCTQCSSYEGSIVLIATTAVSSSVNHVLCIPWVKKTWMLNLTGREEIKFLGSLQFAKGRGWQSQQKNGLSRSPWSQLPAQGRDEYVPEPSSSQSLVIASARKVFNQLLPIGDMRATKQLCHTHSTNQMRFFMVLTAAIKPVKLFTALVLAQLLTTG